MRHTRSLILPAILASTTVTLGAPSRLHTYYVAADEVVWNYVPTGTNQLAGRPFDAIERHFVDAGPRSIGRTALKALYREYTDSSFAARKPRPAAWAHLGFLGPLLRAQVGDTIRVVFRNNTRPRGARLELGIAGADPHHGARQSKG
jgi:hephaestin